MEETGFALSRAPEAANVRLRASEGLRALVDDDGRVIRLALCSGAETVAAIVLDPEGAIHLAGRLIAAAEGRLVFRYPRRRRGGDPQPGKRAHRDEALRELATLVSADLSLDQLAATIIAKAARHRPAHSGQQMSAERRVLDRIAAAGLPLPGRRQLRRILGAGAAGRAKKPLDVKPPARRIDP